MGPPGTTATGLDNAEDERGRGRAGKKARREAKLGRWDAQGFYNRWAWAKTIAKPKRIFWECSKLGVAKVRDDSFG